jgi:hypothetical protein
MRTALRRAALAATALSALAGVCQAADLTRASEGYTYFNRPGATVEQHDAAIEDCRRRQEGLHVPISVAGGTTAVSGVSPAAAGAGGLIGMMIVETAEQAAADHRARPSHIENCMVVKGWRVVRLDEAEGKALAARKPKDRSPEFLTWIGAAEPHGQVVRVFANDLAQTNGEGIFPQQKGGNVFAGRDKSSTQVGLLPPVVEGTVSLTPAQRRKAEMEAAKPHPPAPRQAWSARPPKPLEEKELGGVPAGMALVVVNVAGDREISVEFNRLGPDPQTPAWIDKKPSEVFVTRPPNAYAQAGAAGGTTRVFALAPGRWRLASITVDWAQLTLCMGSPGFDLHAGEVIYAGSFRPDRLMPEMDLAPAKAAFPALSELGEQVRAAEWINGTTGWCGDGAVLYSLEAPGRPFVEGYAMGSRAHAQSAAAPAGGPSQ